MNDLKNLHIEFFGNREVIVDDCRGILEYSNEMIKLNIGRGTLSFLGRELTIGYMASDSVQIKGTIRSMEFN